jgi:putative nucleotidyltransferase with HDIG domain
MGSPRHSQTVGRYAMQLAGKLGMSPDDVKRVRLAGLLHDVGKIGISSAMLSKPGPFNSAEWEHMHHHPEIGAEIARNAELLDAAQWILEHHEQLDGGGYPRGLSGDEISIEARILAISDAYEAMTNDRPYRRALSPQQAEEELLSHSGSQFDADIVRAFLDLINGESGDTAMAMTSS